MQHLTGNEEPLAMAQNLFTKGKNMDEAHKHLKESGHSEEKITSIMGHFKILRNEKQRRIAVPLLAVGVFLCVTGFFAVIIAVQSGGNFEIALYGMTSLGATSIMGGLFTLLG